jgi:glycosyltransferase involved in cell wall biosynthesis
MKVAIYSYHLFDMMERPDRLAGGMELQSLLLGRALASRGIETEFLVGDTGQAEIEVRDGATFRKLIHRSGSSWQRLRAFIRALRDSKADVLLERGASDLTGILHLSSRALGKKFVFAAASDVNCIRSANDPGITTRLRKWLYRVAMWGADAIVVQKRSQQEALARSYGRMGVWIRSYVSLHPVSPPLASGHDVVWISNLHSYKRPDIVLDLAARLPQHRFVLVGGSRDPGFAGEISRRAEGMPNVRMTGFVPQEGIRDILSQARVLINTTVVDGTYEEGFPNTFLQAWAFGVPTVSLISDPDGMITAHGLGFRAGTFETMADRIDQVMTDVSLHAAMSARCRSFVSSEFDADKTTEAYLTLFRSL